MKQETITFGNVSRASVAIDATSPSGLQVKAEAEINDGAVTALNGGEVRRGGDVVATFGNYGGHSLNINFLAVDHRSAALEASEWFLDRLKSMTVSLTATAAEDDSETENQ